nr:permease [Hathewaya proteolytica]
MKLVKTLKENLFTAVIIIAYALIFIVRPETGMTAVYNSWYYLKEMLMIMPVIFVLTALLDVWVPKETIMKYLGKQSKFKGTILSFLLGGISAGPIYAAFPFCIMLHKKGASIKNIVIILSSWAVIKIPMLLNEVKFLGFKFMVIRWILTVMAIIILSWITSKIVKDEDLSSESTSELEGLLVNENACMGCSLCVKNYPELFEIRNKKAQVKEYHFILDDTKLNKAINNCPVKAINFHKK